MPVISILGLQWGDEGKAKVLDALSAKAAIVARYQGGANAGHTTVVDGVKYKFHLVPSGMLNPKTVNVIANGVAVDFDQLLIEIKGLRDQGVDVQPGRLVVSDRATVVLPYHKALDGIEEETLGEKKLGTTKRGIGPTYGDKHSYKGFRVCDFANAASVRERLKRRLEIVNRQLTTVYQRDAIDADAMINDMLAKYEQVAPFVGDTVTMLNDSADRDDLILLEGAQGALLDVDFGVYPYTTATSTTLGQCCGTGLPPKRISKTIGVMKAYTSRVGGGPFPTELFDSVGQGIRDRGGEYGTTTGRPRRIGWLDIVALRHAVRITGVDEIAMNHLDTIGAEPVIRISTAYLDPETGKTVSAFPASFETLARMKPVLEDHPGWPDARLRSCRTYDALPDAAKNYIRRIEELLGVKVATVSVGPGREETIRR